MNYENEADYQAHMQAYAEAEYNEIQQYEEYLDVLIKEGRYELHAIEVVQDLISHKCKDLTNIQEFLSNEKLRLISRVSDNFQKYNR